MQINLELSTPLLKLIVLTLVLVCEYFEVLTAVSLAIQMARLRRGVSEPGRRTAGRLRQLGSLLTSTVSCGIDGLLLRYFASAMCFVIDQ